MYNVSVANPFMWPIAGPFYGPFDRRRISTMLINLKGTDHFARTQLSIRANLAQRWVADAGNPLGCDGRCGWRDPPSG